MIAFIGDVSQEVFDDFDRYDADPAMTSSNPSNTTAQVSL